jgi:hypothetical protein
MTARSSRSVATRTIFGWTALLLVVLYVSCGISLATMSASAELGGLFPYGLAMAGTVVATVAHAVAVGVVTLALRPPAPARSAIGLATAAIFGAYAFLASVVGVGGLFTDTGVSDARWLFYLTVSLAVSAALILLAVRVVRRRPAAL